MDEIHHSKGRFLKRHVVQRRWIEIAPAEAQRKVAHAIQYQQRAISSRSSSCSSTSVMNDLQMKCDGTNSSVSSSTSGMSSSSKNHPCCTHATTTTYHDVWNPNHIHRRYPLPMALSKSSSSSSSRPIPSVFSPMH
jgi:hypothetical protein